MTVLIVDDNAEVRRMIRMVIEGLVGEIQECSDGAEALNGYVYWLLDQAAKRAKANGRKTVRGHDFSIM